MPDVVTWDVMPWERAAARACQVARAIGLAQVEWPSGRHTLEQFAAVVAVSDLEAASAWNREALLAAKRETLDRTMQDFQVRTLREGWWIRTRRRRKARRVQAVTWVKPSSYGGPHPGRWGVLDA